MSADSIAFQIWNEKTRVIYDYDFEGPDYHSLAIRANSLDYKNPRELNLMENFGASWELTPNGEQVLSVEESTRGASSRIEYYDPDRKEALEDWSHRFKYMKDHVGTRHVIAK